MKPASIACLMLVIALATACREEPFVSDPAATLEVSILDHLQSPVVGARVELKNAQNELRAAESTDGQGNVRFHVIQGGYSLTVLPPEGYEFANAQDNPRHIELVSESTVQAEFRLTNVQPPVAGQVSFGFETSAFRSCGEADVWWFEGPSSHSVFSASAELRRQGAHEVWVTGRARVSELGRFGHLNIYPSPNGDHPRRAGARAPRHRLPGKPSLRSAPAHRLGCGRHAAR